MGHDVFLSYSSNDKAIADALCAGIEQAKIRIWMAPRDILPGREWAESIVEAIQNAKAMVVVFSSASNASTQVLREVERAVHMRVPIIPFRVEMVVPSRSMEYFLSTPHWLDALSPPLDAHIAKLAQALKGVIALESSYLSPSTEDKATETECKAKKQVDYALDEVYRRPGIIGKLLAFFDDR